MVNYCAVKNCRNKNGNGISLFSVPKCESEREKWSVILQSNLNQKSFVCEKHFNQSDLNGEFISKTDKGVIIFHRKFKKKTLRKGALPFNKNKEIVKDESLQKHFHDCDEIDYQKSILNEPINTIEDNQNETYILQDKLLNANTSGESNIVKPKVEDDGTMVFLQETKISNLNGDVETGLNIESGRDIEEYTLYLKLREDILSGKINIDLPNASWGICQCHKTQTVTFLCVKMIPCTSSQNNLIPTFIKKIVLGNNIEVFFASKNIKIPTTRPKSSDELQKLLLKIDSYSICLGGPSSLSCYQNCNSDDVINDESIWRHKQCSYILNKGNICKFCLQIHKILSRQIEQQILIRRQSKDKILMKKRLRRKIKKLELLKINSVD